MIDDLEEKSIFYILTHENGLNSIDNIFFISRCKLQTIELWDKYRKTMNIKIYKAISEEPFTEDEVKEAIEELEERRKKNKNNNCKQ